MPFQPNHEKPPALSAFIGFPKEKEQVGTHPFQISWSIRLGQSKRNFFTLIKVMNVVHLHSVVLDFPDALLQGRL